MTEAVEYRDSDHTYWFRGRRYISATQVLDMFKPKFDAPRMAEQYAEKAGATPREWVERWDAIRDRALNHGTTVHDLQETLVTNRANVRYGGRVYRVRNSQLLEQDLLKWPEGVYAEQLLWNHRYGIAGRTDKLIIENENQRCRRAHLEDYKTNRFIRLRGFQGKDGNRKMMKEPLQHLEDCDIIHYQLQLSLYMFMLERMGFFPGNMDIIHFPHVPDMAPPGAEPPAPVRYPVRYMREEVLMMMTELRRLRVA